MKVELTKEELFLIEMAIDEAMWHLEPNTPFYEKLRLLNQRMYNERHQSNTDSMEK